MVAGMEGRVRMKWMLPSLLGGDSLGDDADVVEDGDADGVKVVMGKNDRVLQGGGRFKSFGCTVDVIIWSSHMLKAGLHNFKSYLSFLK